MRHSLRMTFQVTAVLLLLCSAAVSLQAVDWKVGDVFVAVGHGSYFHYTNTGTDSSPNYVLVETITVGGSPDQTSGCAWDSQLNLYVTDTTSQQVIELNGISHMAVQTLATGLNSTSVMFDSSGNLYVGNAEVAGTTNAGVLKYVPSLPPNSSTGTFTYPTSPTATFNSGINSDWIDLANDQKTVYFTGEGFVVEKEDLSAPLSLTNPSTFSTSPLNQAFAVRLLPPFDGTGDLLLADTAQVVRLDSTGAIAQTYNFPKATNLRALTLDPNGTSAWVGDFKDGNVFRFNISTGAIEFTISAGGGAKVAGVCVRGGPELNVASLVFEAGSNVTATAGFGAPGTPNFHTWGATVDTVNSKFVLVVTATEGIDLGRFDEYFCNQAEPGTGTFSCTAPLSFTPTLTPLPYADQVNLAGNAVPGKAVVYRAANPPPATSTSGNTFFYITYTLPPLSAALGGTGFYNPPSCLTSSGVYTPDPRLFDDPSSSPPTDAASNHSFAFDISTFTKLGDWGAGGLKTCCNDYVVADRCPTVAGSSATFNSPFPKQNVTSGSVIPVKITVVKSDGSLITDAVTFPNDITLSITGPNGVPERLFFNPGNSFSFFTFNGKSYAGNLDTTGLASGPTSLCVTSINKTFVSSTVGTATAPGEFPPACQVINIQ